MTTNRSALVSAVSVLLLLTIGFSEHSYGRDKKKKVAKVEATPAAETKNFVAPTEQGASSPLDKVLTRMDQQATAFKNAQASFVWDQYTKVVDDHDLQEGNIYFRRLPKGEVQMSADVNKNNGRPIAKIVLFSDGKVRLYEPKTDQVTEYDAGKNRTDFESFLVLGFGGAGHDLLKSFDVTYGGEEKVQGVNTVKLELVPKSQKMRSMFNRIILWIDPARGVSVQQQFFAPGGDYRLAKYNNIRLNEKINDDVFKLKTTSKTQVVRPNG
jgi:outer membrane lipoprotein-sorting protein